MAAETRSAECRWRAGRPGCFFYGAIRHRARGGRFGAGALVVALAVLAMAAPAEAQTATTFVSNIGQAGIVSNSFASSSTPRAQQFTTGSNPGGYTLTEVVVNIKAGTTETPAFAVYTSTTSDEPGTKVVDLSGSVTGSGQRSFTPASATPLSASTDYFIYFVASSTGANLQRTDSNQVDAGVATGWDIADNSLFSTDGGSTWQFSSASVEIAIKGNPAGTSNNAPVITTTSPISVAENTTAVATLAATDADTSDTLTWSKNGGADADKFSLTAAGVLTFLAAPNFENPTDSGTNNGYAVTVRVSDGTANADLALTVNVTDVDEQPAKPTAPAVSATSGSNTSLDVSWTAPNLNGGPAITRYDLQYRQGTTGNFTDGPQDVTGTSSSITGLDADSSYQVQVRAENGETPSEWSDSGTGSTSSADNNAPTFTDGYSTTRSVAENTASGQNVGTPVSATDANTGDTLEYSLRSTDASSFDIVSTSGQILTMAALNHEAKASYSVTVRVSDGTATVDIAVTVNVTDVNEKPDRPAAPTVSATSGSNTSLDVSWTAPGI